MTVHGRDNFTVASGVPLPDTNTSKDSVKSRVIDLLQKSATADGGYDAADAEDDEDDDSAIACKDKSAAAANDCENSDTDKITAGSAVLRSAGRWLGWCVPQEESGVLSLT